MRLAVAMVGLFVVALFHAPAVHAQGVYGRRLERLARQKQRYTGLRRRNRSPLGTFDSNRYRGFQTRADWLRGISPLAARYDRGSRVRNRTDVESPTRRLLDRRNYLRSRSPLGRRSTEEIGRDLYLYEEPGRLRGYSPYWATNLEDRPEPPESRLPVDGRFEKRLSKRLEKKAEEYFELGIAYFRHGNYLKARESFALVEDLRSEEALPFISDAIVAFESRNYSRCFWCIHKAMMQFETLDDLRMERFIGRFYETQRQFERTFDAANVFAQLNPKSVYANLLLAYFSWVDGDLNTAIASAETALEAAEGTLVEPVKRFRDLLVQERAAGTEGA